MSITRLYTMPLYNSPFAFFLNLQFEKNKHASCIGTQQGAVVFILKR